MGFGIYFHIVVAVDTEHFLHHVAGTGHIHAVSRHREPENVCTLPRLHAKVKSPQDCLHHIAGNLLAYQARTIIEREFHPDWKHRLGIDVGHVAANFASGKFLDEDCGQTGGISCYRGVGSTLIAERRVGGEAVAACGATHTGGIEPCAFNKYRGGVGRDA